MLFAWLMPEGLWADDGVLRDSQAKDTIVIDPIDGLTSGSFLGSNPSGSYQRVSDVDAKWGIPNNSYVSFDPTTTTTNIYGTFHSDKVEPGMKYKLQVVFAPETREGKEQIPGKVNISIENKSDGSEKVLATGFSISATEVTTYEADTVEVTQESFDLKITTYVTNLEVRNNRFNRVFRISEIRLIPLEPYAVLSDDHTTLTFYYDEHKASRNGMNVGPFNNGATWGDYANDITTVVFDESFAKCTSVTSTAYWFYRFEHLTTIEGLKHLNTENVTSMFVMFNKCSSLESLDLSSFKTGNVKNMSLMFGYCSSLTSLDLSSFEACNVTSMWAMFSMCPKLESIKFGNFNNGKTENMESMFSDCSSLTSLDLSSFNTSSVTNMSKMFAYCSSLKSLDLSSFDTRKLNTMFDLFYECTSLESVNVSSFNTAEVNDMRCVFYDCKNLKSLDVSNFDTSKAKDIGGMFSGCSGLTSLDVSNFNTSNTTEMWGLFRDCTNLETIYCNDTWTPTVSSENMFANCKKLSGYNKDEVDAAKAKPIADGGYFTPKNDTRVNGISDKGASDHRIFNLQGHAVEQPGKGMFIREGKKWMKKL